MQIVCPACGVSAAVSEDAFPQALICPGCGKRIRLAQFAAPLDAADTAEATPGSASPASESVLQSAPAFKPGARPKGPGNTIVIAGMVGVIVVVILSALILVARHSDSTDRHALDTPAERSPSPLALSPATTQVVMPWDRAHRTELVALKAQADALAIAGKSQQAYDAYQQIIVFVGDHDLSDPVATQVLAGTRIGQDRVMQALIGARSVTPRIAATLPTPPPVTLAPSAPTPTILPFTPPTSRAASRPSSAPSLAQLDPAQAAADGAPPLPGPLPEAPSLHAYTLPDAVTDAQIGDAILNGVNFLRGQFQHGEITTQAPAPNNRPANPRGGRRANPPSNLDNGSNLPDVQTPRPPITAAQPPTGAPWKDAYSVPGIDALCVYALLHSGQALDGPGQKVLAVDDPFVLEILEKLKAYNFVFTYHRSLRAAALAVFNRGQDAQALENDVRWLLTAGPNGAYTYTMPQNGYEASGWDNSNSQYGLLGVWSGAQVGMAISQRYWHAVVDHWVTCGNGNGTFGYTLGDSSTTMTCAGVASLLVARDYIDYTRDAGGSGTNARISNRPPPVPALDAGLKWLEDGDNCMTNLQGDGMGGIGYGLYGLERVGLASGFKYFGRHDWYSELAKHLVAEQHFDGSWGTPTNANGVVPQQTLIDTAYALLFLARGRHPILFNKLRYDGDWNNRPNDVSHLAKFAGHALERPLNWQVVNLHRSWFDWMDSPVLYISGDKAIPLTPLDYNALRSFANAGGIIFTHADGGSGEFNKWVADTVRILFPKYELMTVPRDHALYSTVYPLKNPPPLLAVSNASRVLLIHSPTDLAGGWQLNWTDEKKVEFQLGVNIFVYAAGKGILKNRLSSNYIPEDPDAPDSTRQIARLEYADEWDPEPYAWTRFSRYFQWETHHGIDPAIVPLKALTPGSTPIAVLTGTVRHDFTANECLAAKSYVQAGGILMIDACGGSPAFSKSVQTTLIPLAFAGSTLQPIPDNHPLLIHSRIGAYDLVKPMLRSYANQNGGKNLPIEVMPYGKGWVVFSRLDITTGLLGTQSWGILGFEPAYAQALMKNAVLWAQARSPAPTPPPGFK
jgi:hypothetical protein